MGGKLMKQMLKITCCNTELRLREQTRMGSKSINWPGTKYSERGMGLGDCDFLFCNKEKKTRKKSCGATVKC